LATILSNRKKRWFNSIRLKLLVSFIVISFLPIVIFFNIAISTMEDYYRTDRELSLLSAANILAMSIHRSNWLFDHSAQARMEFNAEIEEKSDAGPFRVLIFDTRGTVVNDSNDTEIGKTYIIPEVIDAIRYGSRVSARPEENAIYVATSIIDDDSEKIGVVLLVASVRDLYDALDEIQGSVLNFTVFTLVALAILAFFGSQLILDPLRGILNGVGKIAEGQLDHRIETKSRDEFSLLASSINSMAQKLEMVENTREEFVSNVSHELKTPLSSIKVLSESILLQESVPVETHREFLHDITTEIDRMTHIVNSLLSLVKLDQHENSLTIEPVDLNALLSSIIKRLSPLAEQKGINLVLEEEKQINIDADSVKLWLALSNIIDNGIKYTPEEGTVKVIIDANHKHAFITVSDTGIGIATSEQPKVFDRFYRTDKTRDRETGGTGLGLSITHSTVMLLKGSIELTSKEGEGTTFLVRLPIHYTGGSKRNETV